MNKESSAVKIMLIYLVSLTSSNQVYWEMKVDPHLVGEGWLTGSMFSNIKEPQNIVLSFV